MLRTQLSRLVIPGLLLTALSGCAPAPAPTESAAPAARGPLEGVWRISEVTYTGDDARTVTSPQPGFLIFTERHVARVVVGADEPRPELPAEPTPEQEAAAFRPFGAHAGTYEVSGNEYRAVPLVAKEPNRMAAGNFLVVTFSIEGDTLTTTLTENRAGPIANPTTMKWTRVE